MDRWQRFFLASAILRVQNGPLLASDGLARIGFQAFERWIRSSTCCRLPRTFGTGRRQRTAVCRAAGRGFLGGSLPLITPTGHLATDCFLFFLTTGSSFCYAS